MKFLSAMDAHKSGLVDAVVPAEHLILESRKWALDIANGRKPWRRSLELSDKLGSVEECLKIINDKRVQHKKLFKNVPHPSACLDVVEQGILHGGRATTFHVSLVSYSLPFVSVKLKNIENSNKLLNFVAELVYCKMMQGIFITGCLSTVDS